MSSGEPIRLSYPHQRNDCDVCHEYDGDMIATAAHPDWKADATSAQPRRWCWRCAGAQLALVITTGAVVTVTAIDD